MMQCVAMCNRVIVEIQFIHIYHTVVHVWCSLLQSVAICCSVLLCVLLCYRVVQCVVVGQIDASESDRKTKVLSSLKRNHTADCYPESLILVYRKDSNLGSMTIFMGVHNLCRLQTQIVVVTPLDFLVNWCLYCVPSSWLARFLYSKKVRLTAT